MKRRDFVKTGLAAGAMTALPHSVLAQEAVAKRTPRDAEGPFYPLGNRDNDSADLLVNMQTQRGDILLLKGTIIDIYGQPVQGTTIDLWQTDPEGRYLHPDDTSPGARHTDFAYWGKAVSGQDGAYAFRTYVPGAYAPRPAHIHYKVFRDGRHVLTSQIYFRELGGTKGHSFSTRDQDLLEASLTQVGESTFETDFRIVI
ncbi:MAG: twin-arginine translocation signal domain-containing protein [Aquisalinus sp.]|nr:twin-arginine translocation signal domain-containing protein [Aquisalinus sp.]